MSVLRYRLQGHVARLRTKYLHNLVFVHINKTGGSSIEAALGLPFQHRTALEMRSDLGELRWADRFSFAFVRNPWDKVVSHYYYRVKTNQTGLKDRRIPFREWVRRAYGERDPQLYDRPKMFKAQMDWITDEQGVVIVDFIGRFERLEQDFAKVCASARRTARLPHLKRTGERDYRTLYDATTADLIAEYFAADVAYFGYRFDDGPVHSRDEGASTESETS